MNMKRCPKCEQTKEFVHFHMKSQDVPGAYCKECKTKRAQTPQARFVFQSKKVTYRGAKWFLTFDQFEALIKMPCNYCGGPLPKTGSGMDRRNSKADYTIDNVLPSCSVCNWVRHDIFTVDEMQELGHVIRGIREKRGLKQDEQILMAIQRIPFRKRNKERSDKGLVRGPRERQIANS